MKKYEPWAIVLIVLYVLAVLPNPLYNVILTSLYPPQTFGAMAFHAFWVSAARNLLTMVVNIAVAIWLYRLARRDGASPWVWLMFGVFFSVLALILYFAMQVYERVRNPMSCYRCGYDMGDSIRAGRDACPECGAPIMAVTPDHRSPLAGNDVGE